MTRVFLCHSSKDKTFVRRLANDLERYGINIWIDDREIRVGDSLRETIEKGLASSDYVLVVLSNEALNRPWVKEELNAAFAIEKERDRKVILPVLIEQCEVPIFLKDKKYADFSTNFAQGFDDLLRAFDADGKWISFTTLETTNCTVLLDILRLDGSKVKYEKKQTVRCIANEAVDYVESYSPDGRIGNFKVTPGVIDQTWEEGGLTLIRTLFPNKLKRGDIINRTFSCVWYDSFTNDSEEYWQERQDHPSTNIEVLVRFPKGRPPKRWKTYEREGSSLRPTKWQAERVEIKGKPALRLFIDRPRWLYGYFLRWYW